LLVGLAGVDAEIDRRVHGFRELGCVELLYQLHGLLDRVNLSGSELGLPGLDTLGDGHGYFTPSTSTPMLRALPAMVRTAASRLAAVRSGCLSFAISSSCLREILPTFAVLDFPEPFSLPIPLRIRSSARWFFITSLHLPS